MYKVHVRYLSLLSVRLKKNKNRSDHLKFFFLIFLTLKLQKIFKKNG